MSQVYILTREGRAYNQKGIAFILNEIREKYNDHDKITIQEGAFYNQPKLLSNQLNKNPDQSYVFVSHAKGIEVLHIENDIRQFAELLKYHAETKTGKTSWEIVMKALNLL